MSRLLHGIPFLVGLFEYVAVSSALAYAKFAVEPEPPAVYLLGGLFRLGEAIPYDAVPNLVVVLHLLGLFLSLVYLVYFFVFIPFTRDDRSPVPPQEG